MRNKLIYFGDSTKFSALPVGTWHFNASITTWLSDTTTFCVVFESNGEYFNRIEIADSTDYANGTAGIRYSRVDTVGGVETVLYSVLAYYYNAQWANYEYMNIEFVDGDDISNAALLGFIRGNSLLALPTPSDYVQLTATVVSGGRNILAQMVGTVVRDNIAKIELSWRYIENKKWQTMLQYFLIANNTLFSYPVKFFDQVSGEWVTRNMTVSDRTSQGIFLCDDTTGIPLGWKNAKFSLVEA